MIEVRNGRNGRVLAERVQRTRGAGQASRGLLDRGGLETGEALWIIGSMGVHSFGMRFPIDVAYLDGELRVLHAIENMKPNRLGRLSFRTETVLELPAGTLAATQTRRGDPLVVQSRCSAPREGD